MNGNETTYKLVSITMVDAVYECVKCGRREIFFCADPERFYCAKCGRMITEWDHTDNEESI